MASSFLGGTGSLVHMSRMSRSGHTGIILGLLEFRDSKHQTLPWMPAYPFLDIAKQQANAEQVDVTIEVQK